MDIPLSRDEAFLLPFYMCVYREKSSLYMHLQVYIVDLKLSMDDCVPMLWGYLHGSQRFLKGFAEIQTLALRNGLYLPLFTNR